MSTYAEVITDAIEEKFLPMLRDAPAGHCMKLSGVADATLNSLWQRFTAQVPALECFILSPPPAAGARYIHATKLIEKRNLATAPLLVLCPATLRTAAEDSFGNATFTELDLSDIDERVQQSLIKKAAAYPALGPVLDYLKTTNVPVEKRNRFLLQALAAPQPASIGQALHLLDLIPDSHLLLEAGRVRMRLNFNQDCLSRLCEFTKTLYDRLSHLPIGSGPEAIDLRQQLAEMLRTHEQKKSPADLAQLIYQHYPALYFEYWPIPELNSDLTLKLTVEELKSVTPGALQRNADGELTLMVGQGQPVKVKLRLSTDPKPDNVAELAQYRVAVMQVVGAGEYECVNEQFDRWPNTRTKAKTAWRDHTFKFDANTLDPGYSYFLRVFALDNLGTILNANDDFRDPEDQTAWVRLQKSAHPQAADRSLVKGRWLSDSETFLFLIDTDTDPTPTETSRREKVSSVNQSYFRYRLDLLHKREPAVRKLSPTPNDDWGWLNEAGRQTTSHFQIKYAESPYNFQLAVSSKLRQFQQWLLQHPEVLGRLEVLPPVAGQPLAADVFSAADSSLAEHPAAPDFLAHRHAFFRLVAAELPTGDGIYETFDLAQHRAEVTAYVQAYARLLAALHTDQARWPDLTESERNTLQEYLLAVQQLDLVSISGRLPDTQERYAALLISPLHPLRLGWQLGLLDLFEQWEMLTRDSFDQQLPYWTEEVESLFFGRLQPTNHPLLVGDASGQPYEYAGELCFGWGILTRGTALSVADLSAGSSRSLVQYLQQVLDLTGTVGVIENDVDGQVVETHLRNYLALHPYTEQLTLNIFNPGEGRVFHDVLLALERDAAARTIRYEIRLFTQQHSLVQEGEAFTRLLNPASSQTEEAEAFSEPSRNRLFPKLRLSINSTEEFVRQPAAFDAHLSFLVNPFPLRPKIYSPAPAVRPAFYLNGLAVEPHVEFASEQAPESYAWTRYLVPAPAPAGATPVSTALAMAFAHLSQFTAACLANRPTEALPATELQLSSRETVLIDNIHSHSDWVVTFDRHLGPELFDLPVTADQTPFLLDFVPGKQFLGVSTFLTSKPGAELAHMLTPVVQKLVGSLTSTTVEAQTKLILNDLRTVSGSLVMNLSSQPTENRISEYAGIALAKRLLEKQWLLEHQFIIPLDLHQHLFHSAEATSQQRADLLLVDVDVANRTVHLQVVEIKTREQALSSAARNQLFDDINGQITNTIDLLERRFTADPYGSHIRFDQVLRARELSELLAFYAARAARYGLLAGSDLAVLTTFLHQLPELPYQLEFTRRGLVFNLTSPVRVERHEIAGTIFYHVGQSGIQALLDPESEFNTRRPTQDWHRLAADLTRRPTPGVADASSLAPVAAPVPNILALPATSPHTPPVISVPPAPVASLPPAAALPPPAAPAAVVAPIAPTPVAASGPPPFDLYIGDTEASAQYGMLGRTAGGQQVALDLNGTQTISLFGVQGAGKSYSIGTITEMVLQSIPHINSLPKPLAGVIFHYSQSQDYKPEFTSMVGPNTKTGEVNRLREWYDARPQGIADVVLVVPEAKLAERRAEYPDLQVEPLALSSAELGIADWRFLMGTTGSQALYIKHLNSIMRSLRGNLTLEGLRAAVETSALLSTAQRELALSRLTLAADYIDDSVRLGRLLVPGRLLVVDLRDEFLDQDDALGLFVIMLNIFANTRLPDGQPFNKFIVFDEAHKYMGNEELTDSIVTAIREMRHKGVSLLIASQDPPSLPNAIIELSTAVLVHRFNSPQWLKHVQKSIVQFDKLTPADLSQLGPGEAFLWANRATSKVITQQPVKIITRPRVTQHGGGTMKASE
jgi:hypothetical protein